MLLWCSLISSHHLCHEAAHGLCGFVLLLTGGVGVGAESEPRIVVPQHTALTDVSVLGRESVNSPLGFLTYCLLTEMVLSVMSRSLHRKAVNSPLRSPLTSSR